ncbi:MAG TPA: hypothetical protein VFX61_09190 [Micromonosporaceae bacterium]|nr:hypothetical protein [Micromonosporaceae bacterium]
MTVDRASTMPAPAVPTPPRSRNRIWWIAAIAAWVVLLLVLAYVSVGRAAPTVREQRSLAEATPVVHRVLSELVAAAGSDVVVELSAAIVDEGCRITPIRTGAALEQAVIFHTAEADGPALLDRIAQRLPAGYRAKSRPGTDGVTHTLRADAGEFVAIKGGVTRPGRVILTASTGCRPTPPTPAVGTHAEAGSPIEGEPERVLAALEASAIEPVQRSSAACPGDGAIHTVRAVGRGTAPQPLGDALRLLASTEPVVVTDQPDRYAYRDGPLNVLVETGDGEIRAVVTHTC